MAKKTKKVNNPKQGDLFDKANKSSNKKTKPRVRVKAKDNAKPKDKTKPRVRIKSEGAKADASKAKRVSKAKAIGERARATVEKAKATKGQMGRANKAKAIGSKAAGIAEKAKAKKASIGRTAKAKKIGESAKARTATVKAKQARIAKARSIGKKAGETVEKAKAKQGQIGRAKKAKAIGQSAKARTDRVKATRTPKSGTFKVGIDKIRGVSPANAQKASQIKTMTSNPVPKPKASTGSSTGQSRSMPSTKQPPSRVNAQAAHQAKTMASNPVPKQKSKPSINSKNKVKPTSTPGNSVSKPAKVVQGSRTPAARGLKVPGFGGKIGALAGRLGVAGLVYSAASALVDANRNAQTGTPQSRQSKKQASTRAANSKASTGQAKLPSNLPVTKGSGSMVEGIAATVQVPTNVKPKTTSKSKPGSGNTTSFGKAFSKAHESGADYFDFGGKSFNTRRKVGGATEGRKKSLDKIRTDTINKYPAPKSGTKTKAKSSTKSSTKYPGGMKDPRNRLKRAKK